MNRKRLQIFPKYNNEKDALDILTPYSNNPDKLKLSGFQVYTVKNFNTTELQKYIEDPIFEDVPLKELEIFYSYQKNSGKLNSVDDIYKSIHEDLQLYEKLSKNLSDDNYDMETFSLLPKEIIKVDSGIEIKEILLKNYNKRLLYIQKHLEKEITKMVNYQNQLNSELSTKSEISELEKEVKELRNEYNKLRENQENLENKKRNIIRKEEEKENLEICIKLQKEINSNLEEDLKHNPIDYKIYRLEDVARYSDEAQKYIKWCSRNYIDLFKIEKKHSKRYALGEYKTLNEMYEELYKELEWELPSIYIR